MMAPPSDEVLEEAAMWLVTFESGEATAADQAACARWRVDDPSHEMAWQMMTDTIDQLRHGLVGVPSAVVRRTLQADTRVPSRRRALKALAGIGALSLAGTSGWMLTRTAAYDRMAADHSTGPGERRTLRLSDGTVVTLNTASAIDVAYGAQHRRIRLRAGEIEVHTAPDAQGRPLVVATRFGTITPLGTRFVVRDVATGDASITVGVTAGAVRVMSEGGASSRIDAGQQISFGSLAVGDPAPMDPAIRSWIDGMLVARRMPLPAFVAELARYRPGLLRCDPALASLSVSGAFPLDDTDAALALLENALPVRTRSVTPYWVTVVPR